MRKHIAGLQAKADGEKEWWTRRQAEIQSDFMKELDDEAAGPRKASDDEAVLVEAGGPTSAAQGGKKKKKGKN
jgi:translocation protein SEC66